MSRRAKDALRIARSLLEYAAELPPTTAAAVCGWLALFCALSAGLKIVLACATLYCSLGRLLGLLAGWAIKKTPKAFDWTFERVLVRPSLVSRSAWSEIVFVGWTWHDPEGFHEAGGGDAGAGGYILQVDRLTARLELASIARAVRLRTAVRVDLLLLEGVRFRTRRNAAGALNLWAGGVGDEAEARSPLRRAQPVGVGRPARRRRDRRRAHARARRAPRVDRRRALGR